MSTLIKRYANRKLYNTRTSRYITLRGIADLIEEGETIQVVDNETGEDITSVVLSQILVDSERSNQGVPQSLLSQIFERGGDVLYSALRRRMDDASESLEEFQTRLRRMVHASGREGSAVRGAQSSAEGESAGSTWRTRPVSDWVAFTSPDVEKMVQRALERVLQLLDLPRRSDLDALNANLERVAKALEGEERRDPAVTAPPPNGTTASERSEPDS